MGFHKWYEKSSGMKSTTHQMPVSQENGGAPTEMVICTCSSTPDLPTESEPGLQMLHQNALGNLCVRAQLCLILCNPVDGSPPGSSFPRDFLGKTVEWVNHSNSRGSSQRRDRT